MASELWAYKKPPVQTQSIVLSSDDDDDPIFTLPVGNKKRRRLPVRITAVKPINLDSEEDTRDSQQSEQPAVPAPPQQPDEAEAPAPLPPVQRRRSVDPHLQEVLEKNKRLMAELQRAAQDDPDDGASEELEQQQEAESAAAQADAPRVLLVCRTQHHGDLKLRLKCGDPLSKLFAAFQAKAEQKGWVQPGAQLRFEFDGEQLTGSETPRALDMEDEDAIEVSIPE